MSESANIPQRLGETCSCCNKLVHNWTDHFDRSGRLFLTLCNRCNAVYEKKLRG